VRLMQTTWLMGGLCLLPDGAGHRATRCDLVLKQGLISAVHLAGQGGAPAPGEQAIDASGCLVIPGLVNAHTHSPDNLMLGTALALPLESWSLACAAVRQPASPREAYVSTLLGCIEMLRSGTTTVLDHVRFANHLDADCLDAVARAYQDSGMRAVVAPVVADRPLAQTLPLRDSDFHFPPLPDTAVAEQLPAHEQVARVADFIGRWHGKEQRLYAAIGPSGPQRCSDELLQRSADLSGLRGVLLHTHVLETRVQQAMAQQLYGCSMVRHLDDIGLLRPQTNLVHAVWIDQDDIERIASSGATVVHNPVSNARLGSGLCPLPALLERGIPVALGTDSACCNDSNSLLETAKWAALVHNSPDSDSREWVGPQIAFRLATREGARVLGLERVAGAIAVGMAADLALFTLRAPGLVPLHDPVQQLVLSHAAATAALVMVAGRVLLRDGCCTSIAENDVWSEAQAFADRRRGAVLTAHPLAEPVHRMLRRVHALAPLP
jgi:5-methylthioadenosine/S-adenosylhomocysteine deaminase